MQIKEIKPNQTLNHETYGKVKIYVSIVNNHLKLNRKYTIPFINREDDISSVGLSNKIKCKHCGIEYKMGGKSVGGNNITFCSTTCRKLGRRENERRVKVIKK